MKNLKVSAKLLVSFMLVIALMAILAVFSIIELNNISNTYKRAIDNSIEAEIQLRIFTEQFVHIRRLTTLADLLSGANDPARIDSIGNDANIAYNKGLDALAAWESAIKTGTLPPETKQTMIAGIGDITGIFTKYKVEMCDVTVDAARNGISNAGSVEAAKIAGALAKEIEEAINEASASAKRDVAAADALVGSAVLLFIIIAVVVAIIAVIIAMYISGLLSKPLVTISTAMKQFGTTGNLNFAPEIMKSVQECATWKDEIGACASGFQSVVQHISKIAEELESVANGDLTIKLDVLSSEDVLGNSIQHTVDNLNNLFGEINSSTNQVSSGSRQVSEGAQSLAQGSTEQASAVQQLSASISEIAQKTKDNAGMAGKAAALANAIKQNAEKGNRQMDEMMAAVKDINQASQNINKVISVIDSIAFQTNILALNAAVEAARAGQHGKGFAVVAEEVRNLASKSADAAAETGVLIANSIEKAELGARIADETAASLKEIVSGINESSQIVSEIAKSSEEQSLGISQINHGIDQVSHVIQQNSATAEESAAASEEMSGQSSMLEELIARFKLKDMGGRSSISRPAPRATMPGRAPALLMPDKVEFSAGGDFGKY